MAQGHFFLASALFWLRFRHYIVHYAHAHQCHCPPKLLAGRWNLPFGAQPIFWGYVSFKEGTWGIIPVSKSLVTSIYKAIWSAVKQQPDPLSRTWSTLYWPSLRGDYAGLTPLHHASSEVSEGKSRFCWLHISLTLNVYLHLPLNYPNVGKYTTHWVSGRTQRSFFAGKCFKKDFRIQYSWGLVISVFEFSVTDV